MKWFALLGLILFLGVAVAPSVVADDITPPVTTISFDPSEPNGENGWYITNVSVTLTAIDNESGVSVTYYRLNEGPWNIYTSPFIISKDGEYLLEIYSVDVAGNIEDIQETSLKIDQTAPQITLLWEVGGWNELLFTVHCDDSTSGIDRVEFYFEDTLKKIDDTEPYTWQTPLPSEFWKITGYIFLDRVNNNSVSFFAIWVRIFPFNRIPGDIIATAYDHAGNNESDSVHTGEIFPMNDYQYRFLFKYLTIPNDFTGYINRFTINAVFPEYPIQ